MKGERGRGEGGREGREGRGRGRGGREGRWRGKTHYGTHTYTELECCTGGVTTMVTMSHYSIYSPPLPMASQFVHFECQKVPVMGERKP